MFVRNAWYVGAWNHEVGRQRLMRRLLLNEPVVFYRKDDGRPVALEDRCAHRHAKLSEGKIRGDDLECPYHGLTYAPSGECIRVPGQSTIPPGCGVRSYPLVERGPWVWIWMGDPALADPAKIPNLFWLTEPNWRNKGELMKLEANYVLLIENLLDLSHLSFVHPTTLGTSAIAETPMKHERTDKSVTVTRWIMDNTPPPFFQKAGGFKPTDRVDRWQIITWEAPTTVYLDVGAAKAGTGAREGNRSQGFQMRNTNAITPETDKTTHYFWTQAHDFMLDDPTITEMLRDQIHTAFLEDLAIIKAQQANIDLDPNARRWDINHDGGGIAMKRMLEKMIADDNGPGGHRMRSAAE